jgi:protein SCO1
MKVIFLLILPVIILSGYAFGQQEEISHEIGIVEKTGDRVPVDLTFHDESGAAVKLGDLITKPTILIPVYFSCDHYCPQILGALATALADLKPLPGRDYQLITISFDENDDPANARRVKANYIKAAGEKFPDGAWKFLTGSRESIAAVTEAVGFHFRRDSHGFIHPVVLVFLASDGKITGYNYVSVFRYGVQSSASFSPPDLAAGLDKASKGLVSLEVKKPVLYCFPYQPAGQERFFRLLGVTGGVTIFSLIFFFIYLKVTGRRPSAGHRKNIGRD